MFREILCTDFVEMAALRKFRFAAATLAVRIPFVTMLTAAILSQSYQITTHSTTEFVSIHSISKTALAWPPAGARHACWWLCIIIIIIIFVVRQIIRLNSAANRRLIAGELAVSTKYCPLERSLPGTLMLARRAGSPGNLHCSMFPAIKTISLTLSLYDLSFAV